MDIDIKLGDIVHGSSIGKGKYIRHIFVECSICKGRRWIQIQKVDSPDYTGFCRTCNLSQREGENSPHWKGGRYINKEGYVMILIKGHTLANTRGYVPEHRLVAMEEWGLDEIEDMIIHHINGIKTDNRIENLEIVHRSDHKGMHV